MNKIDKEEMFGNLKTFLKSKGVELQEGSYAQRIRQGCGVLTDSVNLSQQALGRAKETIDKKLDQLRQVIHEQTAPKPPVQPAPAGSRRDRRTTPKSAAGKSSAAGTKISRTRK